MTGLIGDSMHPKQIALQPEPNWNLTPTEAVALQRELAPLVLCEDCLGPVRRVAGVDIGFEAGGAVTRAAVAVLDFPSLTLVEQTLARLPTTFPYIPGLLSFREAPAALAALRQLARPPDLILYDGQGRAHPRRFGIAAHLGLLSRIPTIGVAKTRLTGCFEAPGTERGAWSPLEDKGEVIGAVLRTRAGVSPLFVSTGWGVSLPTAIEWVLACAPRFRLPETTRQAHRLASGP
jgi:deoxyribonuclease V